MRRNIVYVLLAAAAVFIVMRFNTAPRENPVENSALEENSTLSKPDIEIFTQDLNIPWDVEFLPAPIGASGPDGRILLTERPGNLLIIGQDKKVIPVQGVKHIGEGGLLGLALHPDFTNKHWIYLYLTSQTGNQITNRVERYRLNDAELSERTVILEGIHGSSVHDGGQLAFGSDKLLYISTGDAGQSNLSQDKNSLNGKILRVKDDGSIPEDNPFGNPVYSYGHRNPQGLAWDDQGRLWATEHGRSGALSGLDELNLIEKGANYGWPVIQGDETREGMKTPVINSGPNETWAPSGLAFFDGRLFFAGLRGETLYAYNPETRELRKYFAGVYGRLRTVKAGLGGIYFTTSNRDGRGQPKIGDDKLLFLRNASLLK